MAGRSENDPFAVFARFDGPGCAATFPHLM